MVLGAVTKDVIFRIGSSGGAATAAKFAAVGAAIFLVGKKMLASVKEAEKFAQVVRNTTIEMDKFNRGTKGLIDTMASYQGANRLTAAGMNVTEDQMEAIGKAAISLAKATGQDATAAFERLASGIAKGSTRALKELGIDLDNTEDLVLAQAEALEKVTAKFKDYDVQVETLQERLFAFRNDLDTIKLQLVDAAWTNFQESILNITDGLAGGNNALSEFSQLLDETDGKLAQWITSAEGVTNATKTLFAKWAAASQPIFDMTENLEDLATERRRAVHFAKQHAELEEPRICGSC
jgi:hypothetical protein